MACSRHLTHAQHNLHQFGSKIGSKMVAIEIDQHDHTGTLFGSHNYEGARSPIAAAMAYCRLRIRVDFPAKPIGSFFSIGALLPSPHKLPSRT